ncbi:hypothetical protein [Zoogloea sp.]|uniref:hypothetical protein n=1 Tax=Zoogloea sp. TaxID=49181 RepID=UPI001AC5E7D2|nr:hypothetical protein [Zoogloea sp.]MBN8283525.1 hypothetical protein [Zoogloea sp.]
MNSLQHLRRGLMATAGTLFLALFICLLVRPEWLVGWGTVILVAMVPAQIVISLVWQARYPLVLAALPQPLRGMAFTALNGVIGAAVAYVAWRTVGGTLPVATPFLIMFLIFSVAITLVLVVPLQCWPFSSLIGHTGLKGAALVLAAYGLAYGGYLWLFDFGFLVGAPFYQPGLDPHGLFRAWTPLVFSIAMLVPVLGLVLFDFWPITKLTARLSVLGRQPMFGLIALTLILAVAAGLWAVFVGQGLDPVVFMVRVCVTVNFGYFILLVMFEGVPQLRLPQPWRGLVLNGIAIGLAVLMLWLYEHVAGQRFVLIAGAPGYAMELWLASAMLAVTFPLMVVVGSYFQFWPIARPASVGSDPVGAEPEGRSR